VLTYRRGGFQGPAHLHAQEVPYPLLQHGGQRLQARVRRPQPEGQAVAEFLPDLVRQVEQEAVAAARAAGLGPVAVLRGRLQHLHLHRLQRRLRLRQQAAQVAEAVGLALQVQRGLVAGQQPAFVGAQTLAAEQHLRGARGKGVARAVEQAAQHGLHHEVDEQRWHAGVAAPPHAEQPGLEGAGLDQRVAQCDEVCVVLPCVLVGQRLQRLRPQRAQRVAAQRLVQRGFGAAGLGHQRQFGARQPGRQIRRRGRQPALAVARQQRVAAVGPEVGGRRAGVGGAGCGHGGVGRHGCARAGSGGRELKPPALPSARAGARVFASAGTASPLCCRHDTAACHHLRRRCRCRRAAGGCGPPHAGAASRTADARTGATVFFKCENLQRMGAFKFRGAYNALAQFTPRSGAPASSPSQSGNHAQAVALSARLLGMPSVIVMPQDAPPSKLAATRGYQQGSPAARSSCTTATPRTARPSARAWPTSAA
jgi:hypothetical protein